MKRLVPVLAAACAAAICGAAEVIPQPKKMTFGEGAFVVGKGGVSEKTVTSFVRDAKLPKEGYRLEVTPHGVAVASSDAAGAFYAVETLKQLATSGDAGATVPCVVVEDAPAYPWRGLFLDESRHFFGKETVKAMIALAAEYKFNVFHWHLTDDQGWRLDIPAFPRLKAVGSVRSCSPARGNRFVANSVPYGPYCYVAEDVREILAWAKRHHVTVMPEVELPGHATAALAAYPEYCCAGRAGAPREPMCAWGVSKEVLCAGNDGAIRFYEKILDAVCELFPDSPVIHFGGDECPKDRWKTCPKCQARMKALGLKDEEALQGWVTRHFTEYLEKKGRRAIGWDEVLDHPGVSKGTMGTCWRGPEKGQAAAMAGHDVVMTPLQSCYFIFDQHLVDDPYEYAMWSGMGLPLRKVYDYDPVGGVDAAARAHVLGAEGCCWTEYIHDATALEHALLPRALALSEVLWTAPAQPRDAAWEDFRRRLAVHRARLVARHVNCARY